MDDAARRHAFHQGFSLSRRNARHLDVRRAASGNDYAARSRLALSDLQRDDIHAALALHRSIRDCRAKHRAKHRHRDRRDDRNRASSHTAANVRTLGCARDRLDRHRRYRLYDVVECALGEIFCFCQYFVGNAALSVEVAVHIAADL